MKGSTGLAGRLPYVAAAAAGLTALLYLLIGLQVLPVGRTVDGSAPDLLAFGLGVGGMFAVAAILLLLAPRRVVWLAVGALQVMVIAGYFAMADIREPAFAPWGLVVKGVQLLILVVVAYLALRGTRLGRSPELLPR